MLLTRKGREQQNLLHLQYYENSQTKLFAILIKSSCGCHKRSPFFNTVGVRVYLNVRWPGFLKLNILFSIKWFLFCIMLNVSYTILHVMSLNSKSSNENQLSVLAIRRFKCLQETTNTAIQQGRNDL